MSRGSPLTAEKQALGGARSARLTRLAIAACALCVLVVAFPLAEGGRDRAPFAACYGLLVAAPIAVGLVAWRMQADPRFAGLLAAVGALFSPIVLSQSSNSALYSVGRTWVWLVEPAIVLLILAFPAGRLTRTRDRRLVAGFFALALTLYLPTALVVEHFPEPSPWSSCGVECPRNAFAVFPSATGFVEDVIRPLRELLAVLFLVGVTASLTRRFRYSRPLLRRALAPVLAIAAFQVLAFGAYQWARRGGTVSPAAEALGWVFLLSLPAVALAFAAGLVNRRLHVASTLQELALALQAPVRAKELREHLADALEDPSLRLAYRLTDVPENWRDESGAPVEPPRPEPGRAVTEVHARGGRMAAVAYDETCAPDARLVEAAASYGLVALEHTRLLEDLRGSLRKVAQLETESASAAKDERKRIERDLHDGAQQRLVALRINLGLLGERLDRDAPERARELRLLTGQIDETIEDVRALAHGQSPVLLTATGIRGALEVAAAGVPLATTVRARDVERYPREIESAVYFCCVEAMQNAMKHARGATEVTIDVSADGQLRFEVRDDGQGFPSPGRSGAGLANIRDRLAALGGALDVDSHPSRGTSVVGTIPID